jgi:hypothetical protein
MEVVDVDALGVLPVTPVSASAAFARAADLSRHREQREGQPRSLKWTLASGEPTAVVLLAAISTEQALCLSHAAAELRHITCLTLVTASRPGRPVLGEGTAQGCVIGWHVTPLVQMQRRLRGG